MFWRRKAKPHAITSVLGDDLVVQGNVQFQGGLQVNGVINGNVTVVENENSRSHLSLHRKGKINGNVSVPFLVLDGEIEGNVICQKFLVIEKNCRITGDVHYLSVNISPGAVVTGRIRHVPEGLMLEHKNAPPASTDRSAASPAPADRSAGKS